MIILSGCAHYTLPGTPLESADTLGPGPQVARIEALNTQSGSILTDAPKGEGLQLSPAQPAFGTWISLKPDLDVGIKIQPMAPSLLRAKYQIYRSTPDSATPELRKQGTTLIKHLPLLGRIAIPYFPVSIAAVLGAGGLWGVSNGKSTSFTLAQVALPVGIRWKDRHSLSLAPYFQIMSLSGVDTYSGSGTRLGTSLGYEYRNEALFVRLELGWAFSGSISQSNGSHTLTGYFPAALIGFTL